VVTESLFSTIYRACKDWKGWRGKDIGFSRIFFARHFYLKTIEEGWEPGFGPNGKPYSECSDEELGL